MMLDQLIKEKADLVSYSHAELNNIAGTINYLKGIINNNPDFREPFLGGSYKRATMVKGISDVDVYFRYTGVGNSQAALTTLKTGLIARYPNTIIKQDKPSILIDFNKIPINITPYKEDNAGNMSIPDKTLSGWQLINFGQLEKAITALRQKNPKYIDLIKVLKLWNRNKAKGLRNFEIEIKVYNMFSSPLSATISPTDWLWTFFLQNGFTEEARQVHVMMNIANESQLRFSWANFINAK